MLEGLSAALAAIGSLATAAAAGWIASHTHHRAQLDRARLLSHIADEVAAAVLAGSPGAPLPNLVILVTQQLHAAAGHNIVNARAIERAATAALVRARAKGQ
jgi:hypothetical protein